MNHKVRWLKTASVSFWIALQLLSRGGEAADTAHVGLLRKGAAEWNAWRRADPGITPDLRGAELTGQGLRGADLGGANLSGANLSQADLTRADLHSADMRSARLAESSLAGAILKNADMTGANMKGAMGNKADFSGACVASAVLQGADLSRSSLNGVDLRGTDLRGADLEYADLTGADIRGANLWRSNDGGAVFTGAIVSEQTVLPTGKSGSQEWADRHRAQFRSSNKPFAERTVNTRSEQIQAHQTLSGTGPAPAVTTTPVMDSVPPLAATLEPLKSWKRDPAGVRYDPDQFELLKSGVPKWNRMRKAEPSVAVTLDGVDLDNRMLSGADLQGARFVGASLKSADLSMARLQKANLRRADLRSANLEKADLRQADLRGATLWRASVGRAKFDGATVSSSTITHTGKPATQGWADELGALFDTVGQVSE